MFGRLVSLSVAAVLAGFAMTACTDQQEQDPPASHHTFSDVPATDTRTEDPSDPGIIFYDPKECESPQADDPYCPAEYHSSACSVVEAEVEFEDGDVLLAGVSNDSNAIASVVREPTLSPDTISLVYISVEPDAGDLPSVWITLEEKPDNWFGFAFEAPRLEWPDGTTSDMRMTGMIAPDPEKDEPTTYSMEFQEQANGNVVNVFVEFTCNW